MGYQRQKWFEIWFVEGWEISPAYLVVVAPDPNEPESVIVRDYNNGEVLFSAKSYQEVVYWLTEDDFGKVTGREEFD